jgi:hypothetical protein
MFGDSSNTVVRKPMSFLGVAALGISAVLVTAIVCASCWGFYGLHIVNKRSQDVMSLVQSTAERFPQIVESLPPVFADALNDQRDPSYRDNLDIETHMLDEVDRWGAGRAVVKISNTGDRIVSLLSMRVVTLDADGDPTDEENVWAATPIQVDHDWRGPLLPGETRRIIVNQLHGERVASVAHEITELRVWQGEKRSDGAKTSVCNRL